ncbi:helix-turn-helix domain-containing protein [Companilactobacillus suantsaicola]|nr:helix-turn-helix domain-containing protein [Companilactobacillus suantsaicola]
MNQFSKEMLTIFHKLSNIQIFLYNKHLEKISLRIPTAASPPSSEYMRVLKSAYDSDYQYHIFIIQRSNLIGLIQLDDGFIILRQQPLPIYSSKQINTNLNLDVQFLPKMIALVQQLSFDVLNKIPETKEIKIVSLNLNLKNNNNLGESIKSHNSYESERQMIDAIVVGDGKRFEEKFDSFIFSGEPGLLTKNNSLRNQKNLAIVATTLFTRAALKAGILPEIAYKMSDYFIQNVENMTKIDDLYNFILNIGLSFIKQIHILNTNNLLPLISKAEDYILKNLHNRLTISDISSELGISESYLMKLFKNNLGISIGTYIAKQQMEEAKDLLIYSSDSLDEISIHLGFTTQAYFSRKFNQIVGMSPSKFRSKHQSQFL